MNQEAFDSKKSEMNLFNNGQSLDQYDYPSEKTSGILWAYLLKRSLERIFQHQSFKGVSCLDIGSGNGWTAEALVMKGAVAYAMDISLGACKFVRERSRVRVFDLPVVCCDGENLPFRNHVFEVAIINSALHHFPPFQDKLVYGEILS